MTEMRMHGSGQLQLEETQQSEGTEHELFMAQENEEMIKDYRCTVAICSAILIKARRIALGLQPLSISFMNALGLQIRMTGTRYR